jgi:hypothetical protein
MPARKLKHGQRQDALQDLREALIYFESNEAGAAYLFLPQIRVPSTTNSGKIFARQGEDRLDLDLRELAQTVLYFDRCAFEIVC